MMKNNGIPGRIFSLMIPLLLVPAFLFGAAVNANAVSSSAQQVEASQNPLNPYLRMIETNPAGVVIEFKPPAPQLENTAPDDQVCQAVAIAGLVQNEQPGLPSLPVQGAMLGIPPQSQPSIQILAAESTSLPGSHTLCIPSQPVLTRSAQGPWQISGYTRQPALDNLGSGFWPESPAELVSTGQLRSQHFAQIRFNPLQYDPTSGALRYYSRILVQLNFNPGQITGLAPEGAEISANNLNEDAFEDSLRDSLLNYEQARAWRSQPAPILSTSNQIESPQSQPAYKILVNQDGFYQVSYAALQSEGVPVDSLDPRTFRLLNQGVETAIIVPGEADGVFNSSDTLLFYGQKTNTKYTDTNVYWLSWGGATGLRMSSLNAAPTGGAGVPADYLTTQRVEHDTDYYSDEPSGPGNDHWYWGLVYASSGPAYLDFTTNLQRLGAGSHTITVHGLLEGYSATPNHHTKIYLNGNLIDDHSFPAGTEYSFSVTAPQSYLVEGTNTLRVECPRDGSITLDTVLVNWFEIDYYDTYFAENNRLFFDGDAAGTSEYRVDGFSTTAIEAYDITDPLAPILISGAAIQATVNGQRLAFETTIPSERRYLAQTTDQRLTPLDIIPDSPTSWKSTANAADYIIISHANFLSQVQPLANYRASQGLRVQVVDVQDLYDEFNGGVFSPEAIKSFLAYAYTNWVSPAPSFVLLVGDGNFDFKNIYGFNEPNYIPPYLDEVDPWIGETATDNRYVSVSGADILPDLYIGRFPVRTTSEAQTMVDKTLNYEQVPPVGGWNANQIFVADNADSGGNFPVISDGIVNTFVPGTYTVDKIYYGVNYTNTSTARSALQTAINQGRLIVHFVGHADIQTWTSETLLKVADIPSLTNGSKLPLMLPMTCAEGYFTWPNPTGSDYSSLGESIVRVNGRGAIASWSPTGYGLSAGHDLLDRSLYDNLFNKHYTQLGYLTIQAKYHLYANSSIYNDLIETYLLFGDPALRIQALPVTLPAPANLQAVGVSTTQVDLTWQDNSSDETEFRIERSPDGSTNWTQIAATAPNSTSYSNTGLNPDTPYYYRVRAYRNADIQASTYTNTANAKTLASRTINFVPGWNLITLPLTPSNPLNAETLLLAINTQGNTCSEAVEWINNGWNSHSLGLPFGQYTISMGKGYFVKCPQNSQWNMEGNRLSNGVTINLVPGWNLIGIPYPESGLVAQDVINAMNSQGGSCSELTHWINSGWASYIPPLPINNFAIYPYEGYFVKCSATSTYTP